MRQNNDTNDNWMSFETDHGTVEIDGLDIYSMNSSRIAEQRSKKIGFIYQDFKLIPYLTIKENILCSSLINDLVI